MDSMADLNTKVVLTYNNTALTDGVGAQLQRIYGTFSVARLIGAAYLHTRLHLVEYQGLWALEEKQSDPEFHRQFNEILPLPSDVASTEEFERVYADNITMDLIQDLANQFDGNATEARRILVLASVPYGIADQFPDCYRVCRDLSPFESWPRVGRASRIVLHVGRGDLTAVDPKRILPNTFYVRAAQEIVRVLEAVKISYQIELWTEVPSKEFIIVPGEHSLPHQFSGSPLVGPDLCHLEDFESLPNLVRFINNSAFECLQAFATADIFVMSRSSFSYVGAILNRTGVVLYPSFWHAPPSWWVHVGNDGHFDTREFLAALVPSA
jgi:hypothetical protein